MIEKAIFVSRPENIARVTDEYSRLYFGVEFCERLIPSPAQVCDIIGFAERRKIKFTLVTPYVTDDGIARLKALIDAVGPSQERVEIVVNDWGFLHFLRQHKWRGSIALGRLLTKQKRGPRIMNVLKKLPADAREHFRQTNADVPLLAEFLVENGVGRIELDNLLQGVSRPAPVLKASLYFPYAYVTTTRYCLSGPAGSEKRKPLRSIAPCNKECQNYQFELTHKSMPVKLFLKGNTQFFRNDRLPDNLESLNIDRLVFEPEIPV